MNNLFETTIIISELKERYNLSSNEVLLLQLAKILEGKTFEDVKRQLISEKTKEKEIPLTPTEDYLSRFKVKDETIETEEEEE